MFAFWNEDSLRVRNENADPSWKDQVENFVKRIRRFVHGQIP